MTTTATRKSTSPRTVQQLEADLERHERALIEAQRANTVTRSALGGHIAGGDAEEIAECRREIAATAAKAKDLIESIEATQDAIRFARVRARTVAATQAYGNLKKLLGDSTAEVAALGDSLKAFAVDLGACISGLLSLEAEMRKCGITPDPLILRHKLIGIVDLALHLETEGLLGTARTLDNPEQLRRNGRASLRLAAEEFHTLTLRQITTQLNITGE